MNPVFHGTIRETMRNFKCINSFNFAQCYSFFFFRRLRTIVLSIKRRFCIKHGENKYQQKFTFKYYVLTPFTLFLVNIPLLTFIKYLQYAGNTVVCFQNLLLKYLIRKNRIVLSKVRIINILIVNFIRKKKYLYTNKYIYLFANLN